MKLVFGLFLLKFATAVDDGERIVGGSDAPIGKYPYLVSLRRCNVPNCGGSILNKKWVLTAANCIYRRRPSSITVVAGSNYLFDDSAQIRFATHAFVHENFTLKGMANDIGLVRINHDFILNDNVQPIILPTTDTPDEDSPAVLAGWGFTWHAGWPNVLQEIPVTVINATKCKYLTQNTGLPPVLETHICTFSRYGEGVCKGDDGGALTVDGVQIGIVSFTETCAHGLPDLYTRVFSYVDWIQNKTNM